MLEVKRRSSKKAEGGVLTADLNFDGIIHEIEVCVSHNRAFGLRSHWRTSKVYVLEDAPVMLCFPPHPLRLEHDAPCIPHQAALPDVSLQE
jgi:hypothetical protein